MCEPTVAQLMWVFVWLDTGEHVKWVDHPGRTFGPWDSKSEALMAFRDVYPTVLEPEDVCYALTEVKKS